MCTHILGRARHLQAPQVEWHVDARERDGGEATVELNVALRLVQSFSVAKGLCSDIS
jgi:hypothetical protein